MGETITLSSERDLYNVKHKRETLKMLQYSERGNTVA